MKPVNKEKQEVTSLIDGTVFPSLNLFHTYLKLNKITQKKYYEKYFPRFDLFTSKPIEYKTYEQYFNTFFCNRDNLGNWLKKVGKESGFEFGVEFIKKRKEQNKIVKSPSQVELRSLICPSKHYFDSLDFSNYNKVCNDIGLKNNYKNLKEPILFDPLKKIDIIIDTREQLPFDFRNYNTTIIKTKLNVGDYGINGVEDDRVYVERKSINDFIGTLGRGFKRFCKEVERARKTDSYIIVVIECSISKMLMFNFLYEARYSKVTPDHIFKNVRDMMQKYDNVQFLFVADRLEAEKSVLTLLSLKRELIKQTDLQYEYEAKKLIF